MHGNDIYVYGDVNASIVFKEMLGLDEKIESFEYDGMRITNFEMESSALAGLSCLMGHKATTVCMVIANRYAKEANTGYKNKIDDLIKIVLDRI